MTAQASRESEAAAPPASVPSLRAALRRARADSAERSGVLVELRTAELARLDLLKEELAPIFAQVPQEIDLFDAAILPGDPARLFVDVLGFVEMGHDKRTYRFFQDTRHGRRLIAESTEIEAVMQAVTDYVARRLVEREKALAADEFGTQADTPAATTAPPAVMPSPVAAPAPQRSRGLLILIGIIVALAAYVGSGALWDFIAGR
jgi:hypothetical protein